MGVVIVLGIIVAVFAVWAIIGWKGQ